MARGRPSSRDVVELRGFPGIRHGRGVLFGDSKPRVGRHRSLGEQPDRIELLQHGKVRQLLRIRRLERRNGILLLSSEREHDARGDDDLQSGRLGQELLERRGGLHDLFEVVHHQQELLVAEIILHSLEDGSPGHLGDAERPCQRRRHQVRIGDRGEVHEEAAVLELREHLRGDPEGQPRLSGPPGPRQGEEAGPAEKPARLGDLSLAADERRELDRQIGGPGIERSRRWEVRFETLDHQIEEVLRMIQVLQPVPSKIPDPDTGREGPVHQGPRGLREDGLPSVGRSGDAGGTMHVDPDVPVQADHPVSRVKAHPNPDLDRGRPRVPGQASLRRHRGLNGSRRALEHGEEGVALGAHLHAPAVLDGTANDRRMGVANGRVSVTELLQQPGRPFDVREQERDRSGGELCHGRWGM